VLRCHRKNEKYGASKLRFSNMTAFLQKLSAVWACTIRKVLQSCPRSENFKECWFQGAPNYSPAGVHTFFWADTVNPYCCLGFYIFAAEAVKTRG